YERKNPPLLTSGKENPATLVREREAIPCSNQKRSRVYAGIEHVTLLSMSTEGNGT
ncbi:hypothetical protein L9F63_008352, partial [Diploptera punctata]